MSRRPAVVSALALWLTACDQLFHVRTGTLEYHWEPQVAGQTVLVPLTFAVATVAMLRSADAVQAGPRSSLVASSAVATGAYLASGLVAARHAGMFAVALVLLWVVRVAWRRSARLVPLGIAAAAGGVLAESLLSGLGEFSYVHPDVVGVPWWLAALYLHGSLVAVDVAQRLRVNPPSTGSMMPVRKLAAGESRKAAARPNSSGSP